MMISRRMFSGSSYGNARAQTASLRTAVTLVFGVADVHSYNGLSPRFQGGTLPSSGFDTASSPPSI
jgi:hypothetical protein